MLTITIPESERYDEKNNEFFTIPKQTIKLEHSLVSLSKWEAKWEKPFLEKQERSKEELIDYIHCMIIGQIDKKVLLGLSNKNIQEISNYINSPMTATWITEHGSNRKSREIVTSELIYYWMIAYNIPFECQKWHLNRLLTLIRICGIKMEQQNGKSKMSKKAIMSQNQALNAQRRAKMNSKG